MEDFLLKNGLQIVVLLVLIGFNLGSIYAIVKKKPGKDEVNDMIKSAIKDKVEISAVKEIVTDEMNTHIAVCPFSKSARDKFFPMVDGTELKADMKNLKEDVKEIKQDIKSILERL